MNEATIFLEEAYGKDGEPQQRGLESASRRGLLKIIPKAAAVAGLRAVLGGALLAACTRPEEDNTDPVDDYVGKPGFLERDNNEKIDYVKLSVDLTDIQDLDSETQSLSEDDVVKTLRNIFKGNEKYEELEGSLYTIKDWKQSMGIQIEGLGVEYATPSGQLKNQGDLTVYSEYGRTLIEVRQKDEEGSPVREVRIFLPTDGSHLPKEQLFFNHPTPFTCEADKSRYTKVGHWARTKIPNAHDHPIDVAYDEALFDEGRSRLEQTYVLDHAGRQIQDALIKRKVCVYPRTHNATLSGSSMDLE